MSEPRPHRRKDPPDDPLFDLDQVASCTECTGLLAAQVEQEDQGENIAALQGIHRIRPMREDELKKSPGTRQKS